MSEIRRHSLASVRNVVIKLGTQLLSDRDGRLDAGFVATVAKQVAALRERGVRVAAVRTGCCHDDDRRHSLLGGGVPGRSPESARSIADAGEHGPHARHG